MDMPSRIEIRTWLVPSQVTGKVNREAIEEKLSQIRAEHGEDNEQDVRDFLNHEIRQTKPSHEGGKVVHGTPLFPRSVKGTGPVCGEVALLSEHEQRKAQIEADLQSRKRLYGGET